MMTITRCPSCATHYQVATLDLQAAKGWLRCGQCGHVFDSTGLVLNWTSASALTDKTDPVLGMVAQDDMVADPTDRMELDDLLKKEDPANSLQANAELDSFAQALSSFKPKLEESAVNSAKTSLPYPETTSWVVRCLVWTLALALLLQLVFVQRHALVSLWPGSEPFMRYVCQSLGCHVQAAREAGGAGD